MGYLSRRHRFAARRSTLRPGMMRRTFEYFPELSRYPLRSRAATAAVARSPHELRDTPEARPPPGDMREEGGGPAYRARLGPVVRTDMGEGAPLMRATRRVSETGDPAPALRAATAAGRFIQRVTLL